MNKKREDKISKQLSYWLRHHPEDIDLKLDSNGWTSVRDLLKKAETKLLFDFNELKQVVQNNDKQRFKLSEDLCEIRCSQGHSESVDVDLGLEPIKPPMYLFHGAPVKTVKTILKEGLKSMTRHHVHLSKDKGTASVVGARRGKHTILMVEAMRMRADGYKIYLSDNGVYLADEVPAKYITELA